MSIKRIICQPEIIKRNDILKNFGQKLRSSKWKTTLIIHLWNFSCFISKIKCYPFIKFKGKIQLLKIVFHHARFPDECAQWNSWNLICQRKKNHREIISCLIYNFLSFLPGFMAYATQKPRITSISRAQ